MGLSQIISREIWSLNEENSTNFNVEEFKNLSSFAARIKYAHQHLKRIGAGSARIVYEIDPTKVLKLAKNKKGIAQNGREIDLKDDYVAKNMITNVFDADENNSLWIIAEKAKKLSPSRFKEITNVSIETIGHFLNDVYSDNNPFKKLGKFLSKEIKEKLWENEFANDIITFMLDFGLSPGDFGRLSSYGEVVRDGEPDVVLVDYGLTDDILKSFYESLIKNKKKLIKENVQQMDKNFVKTGLFDENDKKRILEITNGDSYTYLVSKMYAWHFQIGEYNRGKQYSEEKKESDWEKYNRNEVDKIHQEFISYNQNVFPIENFNTVDGGSLHPIEIFEAFKGRRMALDVLKKIPKVYLRNLKDDIRKVRNYEVLYYTLPSITDKINSHLKLVERLSEEKQNILYKKIFSSKNNTLERVLEHLDKTNINYLSHEDAVDEVKDKVEYEADTDEAELLYDGGSILVVDVKSADAMKSLGCGSQWCFATEHGTEHWANYAESSHVNIIYNFDEEGDSPLRMVVVLPQGSTYNMYNEYMDGEENMSKQEGWDYLHSIGVTDHVNANLAPEEINANYDPKAFVMAEDKSADIIYDNDKNPFVVKEISGHKDYLGVFEDKDNKSRQIGGISYHIKDDKIIPLNISLEDKYKKRGIGKALFKYIKEKFGNIEPTLNEDDYFANIYSNDDLEHVNDINDKSDGGYSGFALPVPTVSDSMGDGDLDENNKLITTNKMNLPIGKIFTAGGLNEVESYLNISPSLLKKAVMYVETWGESPNKDKKTVETLRKIYWINAQNINKALDITSDGVKYYNNLLRLQNGLKKLGLIKEDLEYSHIAGDATKDKFMIGEDGSSLYKTQQGTRNPDDIAFWLQDDEYYKDDEDLFEMNLIEKKPKSINEGGINRIMNHINNDDFAIMSANRNELSPKENIQQSKSLSSDLQKENAGHINLVGHWEELHKKTGQETPVKELSYFIPKPEALDTKIFVNLISNLGEKYGQESVIIGNNGVAFEYFANGGKKRLGKLTLNNIGKAYSSMRKKPNLDFQFESIKSSINESAPYSLTKSDYINLLDDSDIVGGHKDLVDNWGRMFHNKKYFDGHDYDDILFMYSSIFYNKNRYEELWGRGATIKSFNMIHDLLKQRGYLSESKRLFGDKTYEEVENSKLKEGMLTEGATDNIYHFTYVNALKNILKSNEIQASTNIGSGSDYVVNKGKYFFISTTRSGHPKTGYSHGHDVKLVLDGKKLNQNYKIFPTDYWSWSKKRSDYTSDNSFRQALTSGEMEDRIALDKPYISDANKYIEEVHINLSDNQHIYDRKLIDEIVALGKQRNIPIYLFNDEKAYNHGLTDKAVNVNNIKTKDSENTNNSDRYSPDRYSPDDNLLALLSYNNSDVFDEILTILNKYWGNKDYSKFIDRIKDNHTDIKYLHGIYLADKVNSINATIHNDSGNTSPMYRDIIQLTARELKKNNATNIKELINKKTGLDKDNKEEQNKPISVLWDNEMDKKLPFSTRVWAYIDPAEFYESLPQDVVDGYLNRKDNHFVGLINDEEITFKQLIKKVMPIIGKKKLFNIFAKSSIGLKVFKPDDYDYDHQKEILHEERIKSWMPGMSTVSVKKKCRLGGNPDGKTSTACNQGDIKNLDIKPLKDGQSHKSNTANVAENNKWFDEKMNEDVDFSNEKNKKIIHFIKWAIKKLKIKTSPKIVFANENYGENNASFGKYTPTTNTLVVAADNRLTPDILRTIAHELVHAKQEELNMDMDNDTGSKVENQANSVAGILLRIYGKENKQIFKETTGETLNEVGEASLPPYEIHGEQQDNGYRWYFTTKDDMKYAIDVSYAIIPREQIMGSFDFGFKRNHGDYLTNLPEQISIIGVSYTLDKLRKELDKRGDELGKKKEAYPTVNKGDLYRIMSTIIQAVTASYKKIKEKIGVVNAIGYMPKADSEGDIRRQKMNELFVKKALAKMNIPIKRVVNSKGKVTFIIDETPIDDRFMNNKTSNVDVEEGVGNKFLANKEITDNLLDIAKQKNPHIDFPHRKIYENVTQEGDNTYIKSMINEGDIPTLEGLPFKDKVESMGGEIYSVGGAVRDEYLGKPSKDLDIVVKGIPENKLLDLLQNYGRAEIDGKSFGVIKFKPKDADPTEEAIDVALPRTEKSTGAGHKNFEVVVDHNIDIEEDLKRRDFTINAIAKDKDGAIIDPFNGRQDLKDKVLRMTSPQSFIDDELRMLRGVQFASRFDFDIEPKTLRAMRKAAPTIKQVAKERWILELEKIIEKGDPWTGLEWLKKTNLYEHMFGKDVGHNRSDFNNINTMGEYIFMIIKDSAENPTEFFLNNLMGGGSDKEGKANKAKIAKEISALDLAFKNVSDNPAINRVIANKMLSGKYFPEIVNSEVLPQKIDIAINELKSGKYPLSVKEMAINGYDLMQIGLKKDKIGKAFDKLMLAIYNDKVPNEKDVLLQYIQSNQPETEPVELKENVEQPIRRFGTLMVYFKIPVWKNMISKISDDDVYMPNDKTKGIETEPHVTILYGFHDKVVPEDFIPILSGISEPIDIQIKGISHFESDDFDVVKLDCESSMLKDIHQQVEQLPHTKTQPNYSPHMTLAYVKSGMGKKYDKHFKNPITISGTKIIYSDSNDKKTEMDVAQPIEPDKELL